MKVIKTILSCLLKLVNALALFFYTLTRVIEGVIDYLFEVVGCVLQWAIRKCEK